MTEASYLGGETITAFFDQRSEADAAAAQLRSIGLPDGSIRMSGDARGTGTGSRTGEEKGFLESLNDFFFPEEDRLAYEEGIRRGGYLVCVTGVSGRSASAFSMCSRTQAPSISMSGNGHGARKAGPAPRALARGYGAAAGSASAPTGFAESRGAFSGREGAGGEEQTVPVVEEELRVGKRDRSHGRVRVRSYVSERPVSEEVTLRDEHVDVERRPVDRPLHAGEDAFRERSIEAEEHSEEAVVDKQARVVEEVALRKQSGTHTETVSDTVRRTDVEVDRDDDESSPRR
jgi:uncharacterized protein (TIGR02271 family)